MSKIQPIHKVEKTPSAKVERTTYSPYNKEKTVMVHKNTRNNKKKGRNKNEKGRRQLLGNCVWLSGRMHIEEQRTIERRAAASVKAKTQK